MTLEAITVLDRRSVAQWIGATPDTPVPPRVRLRVFEAKNGRCHACTRKILPGEEWVCEHLVAIINGGANAEHNLGLTCCNCLSGKNAADVAQKSLVYRKRAKHLGIKQRKGAPMAGCRASRWKRKLDGTVEER